ncbi:MAG: PD-(D/E)XK nuclease family protein [Mycoplasmatales bacterium]
MLELDKSIQLISITSLNGYFKNTYLVVDKKTKDLILQKSFTEKKILTFKLLTIAELENMVLPIISNNYKYKIYQETKNYMLASEVYEHLKYRYYNNKQIKNNNIQIIDKFVVKLKQQQDLNLKQFNLEQKIYSLESNLDYLKLNLEYVKIKEVANNSKLNIKEFTDIEEEISYIFEEIVNLLENNYSLQDIRVYLPNNYKNTFKVLANYYKIPTDLNSAFKLTSIEEIQQFIKQIKDKGLINAIESIDNIIKNYNYKLKVSNILNDYTDNFTEQGFEEFFINELKRKTFSPIKYKKVLKIFAIKDFIYDDKKKNFILGYNNIDFIKYQKDTSFLSDRVKAELNLKTTKIHNNDLELDIKNILKYISEKDNYILTYSKYIGKKQYTYNKLITEDLISIERVNIAQNKKRYSPSIDVYHYKKERNKKENFNINNNIYAMFDKNLSFEQKKNINTEIQLQINNWDLEKFKKTKNISATLLEKYYNYNSDFFVDEILELRKYPKNSLAIDIGVYLHQLLDNLVNENTPQEYDEKELMDLIIKYSKKFIEENNRFLIAISKSKKEYLINKMNGYLVILINIIIKQLQQEKFKIYKTEENIEFKYKGYNFVGKIDKVLKDDNNNFMVIDYKSGNPELDFSDNKLKEGLNLQNLIYFILLQKKFIKVNFAGTYRYKIVPKITKDPLELNFKRYGYTNPEQDIVSKIDIENYKNLKLKKDGNFDSYSKILNTEEFKEKILIVEEKINAFINALEENNFIKENKWFY